jgi:hypothetical protein
VPTLLSTMTVPMRNISISLNILLIALVSTLFAQPIFKSVNSSKQIDLDRAMQLTESGNYFEALTIVSPCLKSGSADEFSNLEDCLYYGEKIAILAVNKLSTTYLNALERHEAPQDFRSWVGLLPYKKLGINPEWDHYNDATYKNEFFIKLSKVFPISKYKEEYTYKLIVTGENSIENVSRWENDLKAYLKVFPDGQYASRVKLDLANIYDNLWDILLPENKNEYRTDFTSRDDRADGIAAEKYRQEALRLYNEFLSGKHTEGISDYQINNAKQRVTELEHKIKGNAYSIISD